MPTLQEELRLELAMIQAVRSLLTSWGEYSFQELEQFIIHWTEELEEGAEVSDISEEILDTVSLLDDRSYIQGIYAPLLRELLRERLQMALGDDHDVDEVFPEGMVQHERWVQERAAQLRLIEGAHSGVLRGLRERLEPQEPEAWTVEISAGRTTSPSSRAEIVARHEGNEARNCARLDVTEVQGSNFVRVLDCVRGCHADLVCRERAGQVMSIGIARLERLAHPHCTLRFVPLSKSEQARLTPDILGCRPHITREQLIERQRRGTFQTPPDTFTNSQ